MRTRRRLAAACLLIVVTLLGSAPVTHAAPRDRKTLVVRGRITDAEGRPVAGARVTAQGTRRARASADDAGQFALEFPLGSLAELARNPVAIRVGAEQKGWRLALRSGEPEVGFELRVVAGEAGVALCEVSSNDPNVTAALVRALGDQGDATAVAVVNFIGERGQPIATPATPELPLVDRVPLTGVVAPAAQPSGLEDGRQEIVAPEAKPSGKKPKQKREPEAELKNEPKPQPKRESKTQAKTESAPGRDDPPVGVLAPTPSAAVTPPSPQEAKREQTETERRAERERTLAREEARRLRDEALKRDRLERRGSAEEKPRILDDGTDHRAAEDALRQTRDAQDRRWEALRHEVHMIAGSADTTSAPPVRALDGLAGAPSRPQPRDKEVAPPRLTVRRDTVVVRPPQPSPEPPPDPRASSRPVHTTTSSPPARVPAPTSSTHAPAPSSPTRTPAQLPTVPEPPPAPAARAPVPRTGDDASATSRVFPRPEGEGRARARPLVIRAPGLSPSDAAAAPGPADSCACRIKGTIEVESDRPLPARTRVAISLVWYPAIADTVELFMGSPRSFSLPNAPCGPQRLRLANLGALRFNVTSREAMAGFKCEGGPPRQFRVVLQPR